MNSDKRQYQNLEYRNIDVPEFIQKYPTQSVKKSSNLRGQGSNVPHKTAKSGNYQKNSRPYRKNNIRRRPATYNIPPNRRNRPQNGGNIHRQQQKSSNQYYRQQRQRYMRYPYQQKRKKSYQNQWQDIAVAFFLLFFLFFGFVKGCGFVISSLSKPDLSGENEKIFSDNSSATVSNNIEAASSKLIIFPEWITQDILPINEYSRPGTKLDALNGVVVHYTGNPGTTAEQNRSYYGQLAKTQETKVSSHFVIGMDGKIIQCVPLDEVAYCSNDRNNDTISIECCHADKSGEFSQATVDSLKKLLNWLIDTYGFEQDQIIRHYDVTGKECPKYYVKYPDEWEKLLNSLNFPK